MEFFRIKHDIPFMSWGKYTTTISLLTFFLAMFFLFTKGLNLGVDFTGGTVMEVDVLPQLDDPPHLAVQARDHGRVGRPRSSARPTRARCRVV